MSFPWLPAIVGAIVMNGYVFGRALIDRYRGTTPRLMLRRRTTTSTLANANSKLAIASVIFMRLHDNLQVSDKTYDQVGAWLQRFEEGSNALELLHEATLLMRRIADQDELLDLLDSEMKQQVRRWNTNASDIGGDSRA